MKLWLLALLLWSFKGWATPIEPIIVTEQTLKINGEQRFFFAFEEGDQIVVDLAMVKGKFIKEFEILAYPNTSKFKTIQIDELKSKTIRVFKRAVYEFRIKSGGAKSIKMKIKRVPYSTARTNFDTHVKWKTIQEKIRRNYSEKITVTYDTTWVTKYRRILHHIDTGFVSIANQEERVHSRTNLSNSNSNELTFNLPPWVEKDLLQKRVVGWAYWIGVGQEGTENYNEELKEFLKIAASKVVSKNLLAGLALGIYAVAMNPPEGENIHYELSVSNGGKGIQVAKGNVTSAFGRETKHLKGKIKVKLSNDNILNGLNVHVKLLAVVQKRIYVMEGYQQRKITPLEVKDIKGRVIVREREVPIINNW